MRVKTSLRNICQYNDYCMQHCHFVNSTQISYVIKRLRFGKSDRVDNSYSDNFKHGISHFIHYISVIINCMLCHGYAPTSFFTCCNYTYSQEHKTKFCLAHAIIEPLHYRVFLIKSRIQQLCLYNLSTL